MKIFDSTFQGLEKSLDLRFKRHVVLAGNVANETTPNYRAREVDFAGELKRVFEQGKSQELKTTHASHMELGGTNTSHVVFDNGGAVGADGNNVDLDIQMGKVSTNASAYSGAVNLLQMKMRIMRLVARGRGGA